ncbi:N-glycosidase [Paramyrothecium foliicola]|nr:N-glycosidase [Paramyrothecium foliicola]
MFLLTLGLTLGVAATTVPRQYLPPTEEVGEEEESAYGRSCGFKIAPCPEDMKCTPNEPSCKDTNRCLGYCTFKNEYPDCGGFRINPPSEISAVLGGELSYFFPQQEDESLVFRTAEQFMMYSKAVLFSDHKIAEEILASNEPRSQKALGRAVAGFTEGRWDAAKFAIVEFASVAKFGQQGELKKLLLETGNRELVEAAPRDRVWGIGYSVKTAMKMTSRKGWGQNLLGKALMSARDKLRKSDDTQA